MVPSPIWCAILLCRLSSRTLGVQENVPIDVLELLPSLINSN